MPVLAYFQELKRDFQLQISPAFRGLHHHRLSHFEYPKLTTYQIDVLFARRVPEQ